MNAVVNKTAQWASDNKKTILIVSAVVLSVVVTIYFGKKIYRYVVSKINNAKIVNDSESHTGTNVTPTLQFGALVDRLFDAVYRFGTKEQEIYNVLNELRTQADWEALKRTWQTAIMSWPTLFRAGLFLGGTKATLIGTLYHELNSSELQQCRDILISHGITPDF